MNAVTTHPSNNQLLYFTSSSLLKDGSGLVFISDRNGSPNLYYHDLATHEESALTQQTEGYMKSYVYFDGQPYKGIGKASVSLDSELGIVYYLQGRDIMKVDLKGNQQKLNELPEQQMTGFTHVSADGSLLCIPTVDAEAFNVEDYYTGIDTKVRREHLCSYLHVYNTLTGEEVFCEPVPDAWITHVQFSPADSRHILYNHEWAQSAPGIRRLWLYDGYTHRPLRTEDTNRSALDWACHEMWEADGKHIIYHGGYHEGPDFIGRVCIDDFSYKEIAIDPSYKQYGHFTVMHSGDLVSDGYYCTADAKDQWAGEWISVLKVDWDKGTIQWNPLCRHESSWNCQCSHPHPIFDWDEKYVYFTSDPGEYRQVYRIEKTARIC